MFKAAKVDTLAVNHTVGQLFRQTLLGFLDGTKTVSLTVPHSFRFLSFRWFSGFPRIRLIFFDIFKGLRALASWSGL